MSHQSTHHHHSLLNSLPQTHRQPNHPLTAPIKPENDSDDDDLVFLCSVPKVPHTSEDYVHECQCSTCQLVRRLLAKCTCEECKGQQTNQVNQRQVVESSENVPIANAVSPTNGQPSSSSTQNNDASTSEHTNANDRDDDDHSRSSTPDYLPRFFDDESGDSNSDDDEVDDKNKDNAELNQKSLTVKDDNHDPDYVFSASSTSNSPKRFHAKIAFQSSKHDSKIVDSVQQFVCPKCNESFKEKWHVFVHYRSIHQKLKPFYCKWHGCEFVTSRRDGLLEHITLKHFNKRKDQKENAKIFIGIRETSASKDSIQKDWINHAKIGIDPTKQICPECGRSFSFGLLENHLRIHRNDGFRCTWPGCGYFFSSARRTKEHICAVHLQGMTNNTPLVNQYLVKVNPNTGETTKVRLLKKK